MEKYSIVYVKWTDAYSDNSGWLPEIDAETELLEVESVGFLLEDDEDSITIVLSHFNDGDNKILFPLTIPKPIIKEIKTLYVPKDEEEDS